MKKKIKRIILKSKISQQLVEAAHTAFHPTKETKLSPVIDICEDIRSGKIVMPEFQTGVRWSLQQRLLFYHFIIFGDEPVSAISMSRLQYGYGGDSEKRKKELGEQISVIDRSPIENICGEVLSLTDGQQRCYSLYLVFAGDKTVEKMVLDLMKGDFKILPENSCVGKSQIPVTILFNREEYIYLDYLENRPALKEHQGILTQLRYKFFGYTIPINIAKNLTLDQQLEWFVILNNAGSQIPKLQVELIKLIRNKVDIYKVYIYPFNSLVMENNMDDFYRMFDTRTSYPIVCLNAAYDFLYGKCILRNSAPIPSDKNVRKLAGLAVEELNSLFAVTLGALEDAIAFIKENCRITHHRMEYLTYLAAYFVYYGNSMTEGRREYLINWIDNTNFRDLSNSRKREEYQKFLNGYCGN